MDTISCFAIIIFAALIHASFQLSISVLTLLGGHSIMAKHSHARLIRLITSFVVGAGIMTMLLLATISFILLGVFGTEMPNYIWATSCGLMFGVAMAIWLFYYKHEKGTMLWIPRNMAEFLTKRTKSTKSSSEAFSLGVSSVFGELLFVIAPILIAALAILQLPLIWQPIGLITYTITSIISLLIIYILICKGRSLSQIQEWRESNKYFLQFVAGAGLVILGFFVYINVIFSSLSGV